MPDPSTPFILQHGRDVAPATPVYLIAGPLSMSLMDGQLHHIFYGGRELIQRIYAAVRDEWWNTVPGVISALVVGDGGDSFSVTYRSRHHEGEVNFSWQAEITGEADGSIKFIFEGMAHADFRKNRIGLCVLHPHELAGAMCEVEHVSGDTAQRTFPQAVDPAQPVRGLHDFKSLRYEAAQGTEIEISFAGDVFEIEDQRNWTDASFKSYSTPQRIPLPAHMQAGQRVRQVVTVKLIGEPLPKAIPHSEPTEVVIKVGGEKSALPEVGVALASHGAPLTVREKSRLVAMGTTHLRMDVDFSAPAWRAHFKHSLEEAASIDAGVEIALHLTDEAVDQLNEVMQFATSLRGLKVRWLVLTKGKPATQESTMDIARKLLAPLGAPLGAGTDADFFQLNNHRPPGKSMDFVFVPMRPLAHQFDDATLAVNLAGQSAVLTTLAGIYAKLPILVTPVSLRTRAIKGPQGPEGRMPLQADVRQMSLLAAAWTVGCLRTLAAHGVAGVTLFQTTGLRGVMETAEGSAAPGAFHSMPGCVYPVYHVLAAINAWQGSEVIPTSSSHALVAEALVMENGGVHRVVVVNYSALPRRVVLRHQSHGGPLFQTAAMKRLDAGNAMVAMTDAETFLASGASEKAQQGVIDLPPFGIAWADFS